MKKIVVAGTASGVGKTTIASYILRGLTGRALLLKERDKEKAGTKRRLIFQGAGIAPPESGESSLNVCYSESPWSALKVTIRHEGSCPRHTECDTCDDGYEPFKIVTNTSIIKEKGKDTDRLSEAGARKVVWLQSDANVEKAGIEAALACFDKEDNLIIEGNSFLRVQGADVAVLVVSPLVKKVKRSASLLLNKIEIIVINVNNRHTVEEIEECREKMLALGFNEPVYIVNPCSEGDYSNQMFIDKLQDLLFTS